MIGGDKRKGNPGLSLLPSIHKGRPSRWCGQPDGRCASRAVRAGNLTAGEVEAVSVGTAELDSLVPGLRASKISHPPLGGGSPPAPAGGEVGAFRASPRSWVGLGVPAHPTSHSARHPDAPDAPPAPLVVARWRRRKDRVLVQKCRNNSGRSNPTRGRSLPAGRHIRLRVQEGRGRRDRSRS